jgi:hypothetical protein
VIAAGDVAGYRRPPALTAACTRARSAAGAAWRGTWARMSRPSRGEPGELRPAVRAGRDMGAQRDRRRRVELAVVERRELGAGLAAVPCVASGAGPLTARAAPASDATARARARRDITVPIGMSATRAISLYESSSSSRRTITSRYGSASAAIACTSARASSRRPARSGGSLSGSAASSTAASSPASPRLRPSQS